MNAECRVGRASGPLSLRERGPLLALALLCCVQGCRARDSRPATDRLQVFAGIPPVAYLVERIGGPRVEVHVLLQPGQNPHVFQISPRQVVAMDKASLFFKISMPFENTLVEKLEARQGRIRVIDASRAIAKRIMEDECGETGGDHEHEVGEPDPHVWLCPANLKIMAATIADALVEAAPADAARFRANRAVLDAELDALDGRLRRVLRPFQGQTFYVFHPAFGYFADAYGLKQKSVETEGKSPTPRQLRALVHQARAEGVKIIFLQPQFSRRSAQTIADAIGGAVAPIDSLTPNVVENLDEMAAKIGRSLHGAGGDWSIFRPIDTGSSDDLVRKHGPVPSFHAPLHS